MSSGINRRDFLDRGWKVGIVMIGAAGLWTSWDVLRPLPGSGLGGVVKTVLPSEVPADTTRYVRTAQTYLTRIDDEIVALWQKCPHLGCRVAWCESSGEFQCPCHGSRFNRAGEVRSGPSPRGMDRFVVTVTDEVVEVDTGQVIEGFPLGTPESIDEPPRGSGC
ncbi:MAG: Rieske 2Fe-2S domain-containing protein [Acidobacteria bacterium]|nr:Rieske 2Fe-2S domain-containing protein [Acidobacteriota bacterium]